MKRKGEIVKVVRREKKTKTKLRFSKKSETSITVVRGPPENRTRNLLHPKQESYH